MASVVALVVAVGCGFICRRRRLRLLEAAASFSGGGGVIPWRRRLRLSEEPATVVIVLASPKVATSCISGLWQQLCLCLVADVTVDWLWWHR